MHNTKSTITLGFFAVLWLFIAFISLSEDVEIMNEDNTTGVASVEETNFVDVLYFQIKKNKPAIKLNSTHLQIRAEKYLTFKEPKGLLMKGLREINYSAAFGSMDQEKETLRLKGDVVFTEKDSRYQSSEILYEGKLDKLTAFGGVNSKIVDEKSGDRIKIRSQKLVSILKQKVLSLSGSVKGNIRRKRAFEQGMSFEAEEVDIKSLESQLNLYKSVKIQRSNFNLSAENAEIFLENYNKRLKYYTLYDDVKLEEKILLDTGKTQVRRAYAERLVGHQRSGKVVLSGAPRVEQGRDVIKGYQITLRENTELVEVDDSKSRFNLKRKE